MKQIALLGSTGSIGTQTLNVVRRFPEEMKIVALAARGGNVDLVEEQVLEFQPEIVALFDETAALELKRRLPHLRVSTGIEGLCEVASWSSANFVLMGVVGSVGLLPTIAAIESGKDVGLVNKEVLVVGGEYVSRLAREKGVSIKPVDSEHSAIFQCLQGEHMEDVSRLILTASGGPFLNWNRERLLSVTAKDAVRHPTWNMGYKVSIDCSTLMNKGFEVMEARWLFDIEPDKIDVVIHPQSLVHSFVEFVDGSLKAQISVPSMELPIQYAITYPHHRPIPVEPFDFKKHGLMEFFAPDRERFRCLDLAYQSLKVGGTLPCYLNAANEVLVERFCRGEVSWLSIAEKLEDLLESHKSISAPTIEAILSVDLEARAKAAVV